MICNGEMFSAQPEQLSGGCKAGVVAFQLAQSVKDPLLSTSRKQAAKCIVALRSFEIKVQGAENGHYSASWRADIFLRTETVFMRLDIMLGWKGTLAAKSRGRSGVRDPYFVAPLDGSESRQTKALLKNQALFQEVYKGTLKESFVHRHQRVKSPSPKMLGTTQLEEPIHSSFLPFPGDRLQSLKDCTYDLGVVISVE